MDCSDLQAVTISNDCRAFFVANAIIPYPKCFTVELLTCGCPSVQNGSTSNAHNFHVHVDPVAADCGSAGPHYNPSQVRSMYAFEIFDPGVMLE